MKHIKLVRVYIFIFISDDGPFEQNGTANSGPRKQTARKHTGTYKLFALVELSYFEATWGPAVREQIFDTYVKEMSFYFSQSDDKRCSTSQRCRRDLGPVTKSVNN